MYQSSGSRRHCRCAKGPYLDRHYRKAKAYEAHLLTTALDKSATLQSRLADYHNASPELAHWLSRWQAEGNSLGM